MKKVPLWGIGARGATRPHSIAPNRHKPNSDNCLKVATEGPVRKRTSGLICGVFRWLGLCKSR